SPSGEAKWIAAIVQKTLMNPLHAGLVPSREGPLRGEHYERRFWDPEVREQLLATCAGRRRWQKTNTAKSSIHLLNGLVHCQRCGKRLYMGGLKKSGQGYQCLTGINQGELTCPGVYLREELLD